MTNPRARSGETIVRAFKDGILIELVPREVFRGEFGSDLPVTLIDECFHWLNLATRVVDIRKKHRVWFEAPNNWSLNLSTHIAERNKTGRLIGIRLVNPHHEIATKIARIFNGFEDPGQITVFYPPDGPLWVELQRLELHFRVAPGGLLESPSLKCQIDQNQDAGCLHGLRSCLVIRDTTNSSNRAVLVPKLAPVSSSAVTFSRKGMYPSVRFEPSGFYLKYQLDGTLGRLTGAMEPAILYQLALMHALTSSLVPDGLTDQTGSEQALRILRSAQCQPHIPLPLNAYTALNTIVQLAPSREFYPPDLHSMQKVTFNDGLTLAIQRDEFRPLVHAIYQASDHLAVFHHSKDEQQVGGILSRQNINL